MKEIKFRMLRADEIDVRPAMIKDGKATLLLYIDSRAVVRLLNETLGATNWCMEFEDVNGQLVGKLGVWDEDKNMFVYKCDTGSESNIESSKGLFSDCYKRCLSRWGVDELYTAPRIVIPDDGYGCSGYKVSHIEYNDRREIIRLRIVNRFDKVVFDYAEDNLVMPQNKPVEKPKGKEGEHPLVESLRAFVRAKIAEEPNWKDDIKKFGTVYADKLNKEGWNGEFRLEELYGRWKSYRRTT